MTTRLHLVVNGRARPVTWCPREEGGELLLPLSRVAGPLAVGLRRVADRGAELLVRGRPRLTFHPGSPRVVLDGSLRQLTVAPCEADGDVWLPASLLAEALGARVALDRETCALMIMRREGKLVGRRLFLDPGHGGRDPGGQGAGPGLTEASLNLDVARRLACILCLAGAEPVLSREGDEELSEEERLARARASGARVVLSIHHNSSHRADQSGIETYSDGSWEGHRLACCLQGALVEELERPDRGVRAASFLLLREAGVPACRVELLFLSNPAEAALAQDPWFRTRASLSLFRGLRTYFEN